MRTRHSGFRRTASFVNAIILACGLSAIGHSGIASDCDCTCGGQQAATCCTTPRLEEFGGWSLFWHDPCSTPNYCWAGEHYYHTAEAPLVYATVDFLPLFRDADDSTFGAGAGNDDEVEFQPGVRALTGLSLSDWYRIEFSYLGLHSWTDSCCARDADPATAVTLSSQFDTAELNLRRRVCMPTDRHVCSQMSCLVGLRYMKVDESVVGPQSWTTTENDLFGVQIGALAQFLVHHRAWIDFEAKGAMFMNEAEGYGQGLNVASADCTSFLGDLSLQFNYQFAPAWTIRVGYNALWLTGVALACENSGTTNNRCLDHDGDVVYHGPNIGLIWAR